ncbi:MAG: hypothetical protein FJY74_03440 [Candidatus Eisenbacteria bacterium]|nr:hypothetical protein [Candidatus Eisenbacteria bacterium]
MKDRTRLFIAVIVAAIAVSAYVGGKAIVGASASLRGPDGERAVAPGEIESTGNQAAELLAGIGGAEGGRTAVDIKRDPLSPYTGPPPKAAAGTPAPSRAEAKQALPAYTVTALFLDDNPTAILSAGGNRTIVHVGDTVDGVRVTAINDSGVTVEGAGGTRTYPYRATR